ncbi:MAG: hypothetical protein KBD37_03490 [Burkholderiales bacterium]|nr:hypothetical protein [Burkholderiales bacterium]
MSKKIVMSQVILFISLWIYSAMANAADTTGIAEIDDMVSSGQSILKVAAKWGGILTVVGAALALGSGRLEGALAKTICKILVVIGLLMAAYTYFGNKISWGFAF